MLCTVGDLVEDVVVWLPGPAARGTDTPCRVFRRRGGSAANVAAFAANVAGVARFVGRVGKDALGDALVADLATAGVDVLVRRGGRTGTVVVLVEPGGERSMLPDRGAATDLVDVPDEWLEGVCGLHLPAYSLVAEPLATTTLGLATAARARGGGVRVSVDASSTSVLAGYGADRFRSLLARLAPDVLLANAEEAALLGLEHSPPPGVGMVVVKDGPRPVRVIDDAMEPTLVDVQPLEGVIDTTGAGDAFAAGFLTSLLAGSAVAEAAASGCRLAAVVLTRPGASTEERHP